MNKKCSECGSELVKVDVSVEDADSKAVSWQCESCGYFEFEEESSNKVVNELKSEYGNSNIEIKQEIIKLSDDKLGIYFDDAAVKNLHLTPGKEVLISFPSKKIVVRIFDN